jgi:predicted transcriptional regulator
MKPVSLRLDDKTSKRLQKAKEVTGVPKEVMMRRAITRYLDDVLPAERGGNGKRTDSERLATVDRT